MAGTNGQDNAAVGFSFDFLFRMPWIFFDPGGCVGTDSNPKCSKFAPAKDADTFTKVLFQVEVSARFKPVIQSCGFAESIQLKVPDGVFRVLSIGRIGDDVEAAVVKGDAVGMDTSF